MTEEIAQSWLSAHFGAIPALDEYHQMALETLENPHKNLADLAEVITLDPGMSLSLYQQVNSGLLNRGKPMVESADDALSVMGASAVIDLVTQHKTLSEMGLDNAVQQAYRQLASRCYYLLALADLFDGLQGVRPASEIRSAAILHNIGEVYACLFDYRKYQKYQANFHLLGADVNSAKPVFGFGFRQLGRVICKKMNLPPLVIDSMNSSLTSDRRLVIIQFAADISHQAEEGWYHSAMKATQQVCARYLNQAVDSFDSILQETAISAARECPIKDALPAAARLIMPPEQKFPERLTDSNLMHGTDKPEKHYAARWLADDRAFQHDLKQVSGSANVRQTRVIDLLLDHLDNNLHMSRALFLQLSADKAKLGADASRGIKAHSVLHKMMIDVRENRMFRSLLAKPRGLWVDPASYGNYDDFLPDDFKNCVLSEDFFLMTVFSETRSVGVIFCDRAQSVSDLDRESYLRFKAAMMQSSNALGYPD